MDGSTYEPSYSCNILGLDRSIPIPSDLDPQDFILLDVCMNSLDQQIPTPPVSLQSDNHNRNGSAAESPIYQADWSSATLVSEMKELSTNNEKPGLETGSLAKPPVSSPGVLYPSGVHLPIQKQRFLLQAGEEPPELLEPNLFNLNGVDTPGRKVVPQQTQQYSLYVETVNDILDYKLPRDIEEKRLALLREEWISKSIQFHNLYKTGKASDESVVDGFLQSMLVDRRDLKILRFFTRCAKSNLLQSQKYRNDDLAFGVLGINRNVAE